MPAQHQHYVPKLLLRGFLSQHGDEAKSERVRVFDLVTRREFSTSIDNIMGERRYNDFWIDDESLATIEPAAGRVESHVAPLVERLRGEKKLARTSEELGDLTLLFAFQFIRTKRIRLLPAEMRRQLSEHIVRMGFDPDKVEGLPPLDEEALKKLHTKHQVENLFKYMEVFADKEFFLMTAPDGGTFYLGDHPVVLHNDEKRRGVFGGLGLGVPYIQIYLPLSADLMLCAYDKAVLGNLLKIRDADMRKVQSEAVGLLMSGRLNADGMREAMQKVKAYDVIGEMMASIKSGTPIKLTKEPLQFYNSLQAYQAHRFVVDPRGDFTIAKEVANGREKDNKAT